MGLTFMAAYMTSPGQKVCRILKLLYLDQFWFTFEKSSDVNVTELPCNT